MTNTSAKPSAEQLRLARAEIMSGLRRLQAENASLRASRRGMLTSPNLSDRKRREYEHDFAWTFVYEREMNSVMDFVENLMREALSLLQNEKTQEPSDQVLVQAQVED